MSETGLPRRSCARHAGAGRMTSPGHGFAAALAALAWCALAALAGCLMLAQPARAAASPSPVPAQPPAQHAPHPAARSSIAHASPGGKAPAHMPFYVARKGQTTIYVLGTLHVGDPNDYPPGQPFRAPLLAALEASPTLAFELSPDDLVVSQDDVTRSGVCAYACLPRLLPAALWQKLAKRLRGNQPALAEIKKMRPWLAALLVETLDSLDAGLQTEYGSEAQLENIYTAGHIVGLESLDEQMRAFTELSRAEQNEMLAQDLVQTPAQNVADVRALHGLWQGGDADALARWQAIKSAKLARDKRVSDAIDDKILYERNRRFVVRTLLLAAPNRPVFVAVGALHLGGSRGMLALLRNFGFVVRPA
jgi:uncharacterized protein YbaP (TraB family)